MATSDNKPTASEAFKHNLAPPKHASTDKTDGKFEGKTQAEKLEKPAPAPSAEVLAKQAADKAEADRKAAEAEVKDSRKGTAVDGLNLPEKQGEVLWQTGINIGAREHGESDKALDKRFEEAERTIVGQALNVMSGPGGIRPNGYQLVRDDNAGVLRLNLVSADPEYPDPKLVGGIPNADGTY